MLLFYGSENLWASQLCFTEVSTWSQMCLLITCLKKRVNICHPVRVSSSKMSVEQLRSLDEKYLSLYWDLWLFIALFLALFDQEKHQNMSHCWRRETNEILTCIKYIVIYTVLVYLLWLCVFSLMIWRSGLGVSLFGSFDGFSS